jgi:transaldolase
MPTSLLQQLRSLVVIDVDSMDPDVSQRHTGPGEQFQNMTSNQALAFNEAIRPENVKLVKEAIDYVRAKNLDQDPEAFKMDVIDTLVCYSVSLLPN